MLEGKPGQPAGRVTIQGAKMHTFTQEPVFSLNGYAGQLYYGQSQFYNEPKEPRFVASERTKVRLILAGHFWYDTKPRRTRPPGQVDHAGEPRDPGLRRGRQGAEGHRNSPG